MAPEEWAALMMQGYDERMDVWEMREHFAGIVRRAVAENAEACARVAESYCAPGHFGVCDPGRCDACDRQRAVAEAIRAIGEEPAT